MACLRYLKCFHKAVHSHLKYVGEDEKQDFLDWAIEEGCMPSVKEVSQVRLRLCFDAAAIQRPTEKILAS